MIVELVTIRGDQWVYRRAVNLGSYKDSVVGCTKAPKHSILHKINLPERFSLLKFRRVLLLPF